MEIRMLQQYELLSALHLVWDVFADEIAPSYNPEGIAEFQKFIKYDNIYTMCQRREIFFFGAFQGTELCGTIAVKNDGHISLFFVRKQYQGKGIGRMLFQCVYNYCAQQLCVKTITVNSAPQAVQKYIHLGMHVTAEEQVVNGIRSVPLEMYVIPGLVRPVKKKSKKPIIIVSIICMVIVIGLFVGEVKLLKSIQKNIYDVPDIYEEFAEEPNDEYDLPNEEKEDSTDEENLQGIESIPEKIEENLSYEITEDTYSFSDREKESMLIEFNVTYPVVHGLPDADIEEKVNKALKNCAMQTVNEIYNNPSNTIKERVISEKNPMLISYAKYKVCYASDDLISIAYEDYNYEGGSQYYSQHLRTCNINPKTGEIYQLKDLVDINDEVIDQWLQNMRDETKNDSFLSELSKEEIKKTLEGDSLDGVYIVNYYMDEKGVQVGYDLNYKKDDSHDLGFSWVTAKM